MANEGFAIGFNVKQVNTLMENIKNSYEGLKLYINDGWAEVKTALHTNWVGEDEQSFETNFAKRICTLYDNAYALAQGSLDTIEGLAISWNKFQQSNTLDGSNYSHDFHTEGGTVYAGNTFCIEKPTITKAEGEIVKADLTVLLSDTNRGLAKANSASLIQDAVTNFVNNLRNKTADLFNEIQVNSAFFGDQTTAIKAYVEKTGVAIGEVTVALRDLHTALETLANSSYVKASSDVSAQFTQASGNIDSTLNDLGNSRWGA